MSAPAFSRSLVRGVCATLAIIILADVSPLAVCAAEPPAPRVQGQLAALAAQLRSDIKLLDAQGKEAFVDALFARMQSDEARALQAVTDAVKSTGAKPLGMQILGIGSDVLRNVLSVVPESWQESIVISTLSKFIGKALRQVRTSVAAMSAPALHQGLEALLKLVTDPRFASGQALTGDSWWERFFSNSTIVKNFLVVVVTLASIGVAVGLAIAGSTVGPIVAVVGALVALIALLNSGRFALS